MVHLRSPSCRYFDSGPHACRNGGLDQAFPKSAAVTTAPKPNAPKEMANHHKPNIASPETMGPQYSHRSTCLSEANDIHPPLFRNFLILDGHENSTRYVMPGLHSAYPITMFVCTKQQVCLFLRLNIPVRPIKELSYPGRGFQLFLGPPAKVDDL